MTHYAISDNGTDVRFECESEPEAVCRWECDCETWATEFDSYGRAWHVGIDHSASMRANAPVYARLHRMRTSECWLLPWLENQECGPVEAGEMETNLVGRHRIDVEWIGLDEGWYWEYAEGES